MLRTNSKKAAENIRSYILEHFSPEGYTEKEFDGFPEVAAFILETMRHEKQYSAQGIGEPALFEDWAQGLPSLLDTCYYYNRSAVADLGDILEEAESKRKGYTEERAEHILTCLIYRELVKGAATK